MWEVNRTKKVIKQIKGLPLNAKRKFLLLFKELIKDGPFRKNWSNYGPLKGHKKTYHCHILKGKPTYIVVWIVKDKKIKLMEVSYVGTHEKAPY